MCRVKVLWIVKAVKANKTAPSKDFKNLVILLHNKIQIPIKFVINLILEKIYDENHIDKFYGMKNLTIFY